MSRIWSRLSIRVLFVIWASFIALSPATALACTPLFSNDGYLLDRFSPILTQGDIQKLFGSNYPNVELEGHINFLRDDPDPCSWNASMLLVLPGKGSVRISPHSNFYNLLLDRCKSSLFGQSGSGLDRVAETETENEDELDEFFNRCSVGVKGEYRIVGDDPLLIIQRVTELTRFTGKLELEHLNFGVDDYEVNLCKSATIRRTSTNSWEWWERSKFADEARKRGLDCPKLMNEKIQVKE